MAINKSLKVSNIKGILFDVDGTLYHQAPLRAIMVFLLILLNLHNPKELLRKIRVIAAYRQAQETLRNNAQRHADCARRQVELASKSTEEPAAYISETTKEWFEKRPLPYLHLCCRRGINTVIGQLHQKGFKLGVFSDYPAREKLSAMGVLEHFSTVVSGNDAEIRGFKPKTNGFTVAAKRMGLDPSEILYIGDRANVDGAGASAAGMPVIIVNGLLNRRTNCDYHTVNSLYDILEIIKHNRLAKS